MSQINLLPPTLLPAPPKRLPVWGGWIVMGAIAVVLSAWIIFAVVGLQSLDRRINQAGHDLHSQRATVAQFKSLEEEVTQLRRRLDGLTKPEPVLSTPGLLALVSQQMPETIVLDRLHVDYPYASHTRGTHEHGLIVKLHGQSSNVLDISRMLSNFEAIDIFDRVSLNHSSESPIEGRLVNTFTMSLWIDARLDGP